MTGKNITCLGQEVEVGRDTSFQALLERESYIAVLEAHRWHFRRGLSLEVGRNISGIQGDRQRRAAEHMGAWRVGRDVLERLGQHSLRDRWPLRLGTRKMTGPAHR